jgi:hypothetical protein
MHIVLFIFRVLPAIKLYDNFLLKGDEVYDVCFNRLLSAEFDTLKLTVSQMTPEYAFNISCVISQFYSIFLKAMTWFHGAFPHPLTPSRKGRGDILEPLKLTKLQFLPDKGGTGGVGFRV